MWVMSWSGEGGRGGDVEPRNCHDLSSCLVSGWSSCWQGSGECPVSEGGQAGSQHCRIGGPGRLRGQGASGLGGQPCMSDHLCSSYSVVAPARKPGLHLHNGSGNR